MTFIAHYWQYSTEAEEECDTLSEAVSFLAHGWGEGRLSQDCITGPDGAVVLEGAALLKQMTARLGA